jgi:signal transduction histidine kinase
MKLDYLSGKKTIRQAEVKNELPMMSKAANESYDLLRGTLAVLQSIDSAELHRLFSRYAEQVEERSTFKITFSSQGEVKPLSAPRIRQLFYIFRETLNNIEKHAGATQVNIEMIWNADSFCLVVFDDGRGFELNQVQFGGHYGLKFMRERVDLLNGSLSIHSANGTGTKIVVEIPYEPS